MDFLWFLDITAYHLLLTLKTLCELLFIVVHCDCDVFPWELGCWTAKFPFRDETLIL